MAGQSDQEKETKKQLGAQKTFQADVTSGKYNVANPFDNYQSPFDYQAISDNLDKIYSGQTDLINKSTADAVAEGKKGAVSSLASRGITGGSAVDTALSGVASDINKSKNDALTKLGVDKAGAYADLMKYFNNEDYRKALSEANINFQNVQNVLGGLTGSQRLSANLLSGLDNTTWLDDALGLIKTGTDAAASIAGIPGI